MEKNVAISKRDAHEIRNMAIEMMDLAKENDEPEKYINAEYIYKVMTQAIINIHK